MSFGIPVRNGLGVGLLASTTLSTRNSTPFSPASLFAAGEQGAWYDPSDLTTLFQDTAGTIPVTTAGQSVALMLDKSGRGNHATQTTLAQRPTYNVDGSGLNYLLFDGTDDGMLTSTITPAIDKAQVFAGARKLSDAAGAILCELSASYTTNQGSLYMSAPNDAATQRYGAISRGNAAQTVLQGSYVTGTGTAPDTSVLAATYDIAGDQTIIRRNGTAFTAGTANQGTGNFLAYPLYIGRRGGATIPFNGRIYSMIVRFGANLSANQITQTEAWVNSKTGAY